MNWQAISVNPFFTVALPMMMTFLIASWTSIHMQNKRAEDLRSDMNRNFDRVDKRFDKIEQRLERIEAKLEGHAERIAKLEGPALVRTH